MRWPARAALVLLGSGLSVLVGAVALRQNAAVRPVWPDAHALRLAQANLAKVQAGEASAQQAVAQAQQQAQSLAQTAAAFQAQAAAPLARGSDDGRREHRGFGGDF